MLNQSTPRRGFLRGLLLGFTALTLPGVLSAREFNAQGMPWTPGAALPPRPAPPGQRFFTPGERAITEAVTARLIPSDDTGPGASEAGVAAFIDQELAGFYGRGERWFMQGPFPAPLDTQGYQSPHAPAQLWRHGLAALEAHCQNEHGAGFAALAPETQDAILEAMEDDNLDLGEVQAAMFFDFMREMTIEGFFCDPVHGGNRDMLGWRLVGFPGARYDYRDVLNHGGAAIDMPPVALMGRPGWASQ